MTRQFFYNFSGRNFPDYSQTAFNTMLVMDGIIRQIGFDLPYPKDSCICVDLNGKTVLPAFADAHVHFNQTGLHMLGCHLHKAQSIAEVLDLLKEEGKTNKIIMGWDLQELNLKEKRLPTVKELDSIGPNRFVWAVRRDMHSAVASTSALEWALSVAPDIIPDGAMLSGLAYYRLLYEIPSVLPAQMINSGMKQAEQQCFNRGVATIHALEGSPDHSDDSIMAAIFFNKSRLNGVIYNQSPDPTLPVKMGWKHIGGCLMVDGSFGTRTAALEQPYSDAPGTSGSLYLTEDEIFDLLETSRLNNLQLAIHAIGDSAIRRATECYLAHTDKWGIKPLPDRIEHFVLPDRQSIFAALKSSAMLCVQPTFDHFWGGEKGLYSQRLGKYRASLCNPFKTLLNMGLILAGGSDSPVTPIDPLLGIQALVEHSNPDERLDLNTAISLYTTEPHKLSGQSDRRGQLKCGYNADFVCLASDLFKVDASSISGIAIDQLYIQGHKTIP